MRKKKNTTASDEFYKRTAVIMIEEYHFGSNDWNFFNMVDSKSYSLGPFIGGRRASHEEIRIKLRAAVLQELRARGFDYRYEKKPEPPKSAHLSPTMAAMLSIGLGGVDED